ncbi:carboxypeptidase-like regulatory domain-containing protein [Muriicola sp. E247]|uniref:carboxypeptidase-like regulatory domain-containing protein n=1 Tax=Muriicola sp. E247 TaxID=3242730 RepID=UPI0035256FC2
MFPTRSVATLLFVLAVYQLGYGQRDYKGVILDKNTNEPIPYVNIGFPKKGIGTVSDEEGLFHLEIDTKLLGTSEILQFSSLGYSTINRKASELEFSYNEYPIIYLEPKAEQLNPVVVTDAGLFESGDRIGYKNGGHQFYGYWKDNIALGGELATRIKVKKGLRRLNEFNFEVWGNTSDSVLVRINFYDTDGANGFPGTNLNSSGRNILYTIPSTPEVATVDLRQFDLFVRDDFIVSLELLKVYGPSKIGLVLAAANNRFTDSYKKYASQDDWKILIDAAMAYELESTLFSKKAVKDRSRNKKKAVKSIITGYVFHGNIALPNVKVTNFSNGVSVNTNENGNYQIEAKKGDLLQFNAKGMETLTVKILEKKFINIRLERS